MGLEWTSWIFFREYYTFCVIRMWVDLVGYGPSHLSKSVFWARRTGLCLGCYGGTRAWHGAHCAFGLASGILGLFLYPYQLPPNPCVRTAWARAVIIPTTVAISTCLFGYGLIKPDRCHTWNVNDGPLGFALVFHTPLVFPCFLPTSPVLSSFGPIPSFLISLCSCTSFSPRFSSV